MTDVIPIPRKPLAAGDRQDPYAGYTRLLLRIETDLYELATAMRLLRHLRSRPTPGAPLAGIPPETLKVAMRSLSTDLRQLQRAASELERFLTSWAADGTPPG